ncbi:MAG: DUF2256 domain-containing protein [Cyanobacteria bacterium]|nr:DUF2256 domain-containing protein [Cyanobacteriota bacterium]
MGRQRKKADFPSKVCPVCDRPFVWRKKWADCWEEVKYCSDRCRRRRLPTSPAEDLGPEGD